MASILIFAQSNCTLDHAFNRYSYQVNFLSRFHNEKIIFDSHLAYIYHYLVPISSFSNHPVWGKTQGKNSNNIKQKQPIQGPKYATTLQHLNYFGRTLSEKGITVCKTLISKDLKLEGMKYFACIKSVMMTNSLEGIQRTFPFSPSPK